MSKNITTLINYSNKTKEKQMGNEKLYIGSKLITAYPLDECSFLKNFKGQDTTDRESRPGYLVKYPDGYDILVAERSI